jgi:hypothetical protein
VGNVRMFAPGTLRLLIGSFEPEGFSEALPHFSLD